MPPTRSCQMPCTNTTSSWCKAGKHVLFGWRHESSPHSGISQNYIMHSNSNWFTEICSSHCVSHVAASLIATWPNTFITDACNVTSAVSALLKPWSKTISSRPGARTRVQVSSLSNAVSNSEPTKYHCGQMVCVNDLSACAPTETLLRSLLNKVHDMSSTRFTHWTLLQSK